jgi:glycosyltransferase involved in cell wall biosynthesis
LGVDLQNKFKIICPSYNNEDWIETHIGSILEQTYDNYEVLYMDDYSTDNTWKLVNEFVGDNPKFKLIRNDKNYGAAHNYTGDHLYDFVDNDEEILIHLDGDDWLALPDVLEKLNEFYIQNDYWMTYGGFLAWEGGEDTKEPYPQNTEYDKFIHKNNKYRSDLWRASHLRTYKWFLWKSINKKDFVSNIDNKLFWHASDLSWAYPCLEMCPSDKIGVANFITCIYNASNQNQNRTQERENQNNEIYEIEIRNKKKYKTVASKKTLKGEKLPQVNVFGDISSAELCSIPTKFSYCYNVYEGEYDLVLLNDSNIEKYLNNEYKIKNDVPIVARLLEQRDYFQSKLMNKVKDSYQKFHTILTFDKILLNKLPNTKFCNAEGITAFTVFPNALNISPYHPKITKDFNVSQTINMFPKDVFHKAVCITSAKAFLPGHNVRLNFINNSKDKIDLYGMGIREVESKLDVLHNYAFSLAIENNISKNDYYFTEKLVECIITGTIPIYYGCPNIGEFFDLRGIITFDTQEELDHILDNLNEEQYNSMLEYAKINYEKALKSFVLDNNSLYELHLKNIIKDGTII